jgi:hypothetical protein
MSNTSAEPRRVRIRDPQGRILIARLHGSEQTGVVMLPDGQLGWPKGLAFTDDPFVPETADSIASGLLQEETYRGFQVLKTDHYVVLYRSRPTFAQASAHLLESLHDGLIDKLRAKGLDVHPAEFPLVAIIFADEKEFRAASQVPEDVQAYYNVVTNRIYFYETSERDQGAPDVAARKRPQTVAHEGTHQILQNIGLHPRLASWPPWLVEGLAEYFAPTTINRDGSWDGANKVNPFHMATIRDLQDPLAVHLRDRGPVEKKARDPRQSLVEYLITRTELTPTDYAWSWALTHYLANRRFDEFLKYLQDLSQRPPRPQPVQPVEHLADFRKAFGADLGRMDKALTKYLAGLKHFESLPYYAVTFQQPLASGVLRRAAMVSQSPAMIRQWVEETTLPQGGPPVWHAQPFPTRTRARLAAETWINGS